MGKYTDNWKGYYPVFPELNVKTGFCYFAMVDRKSMEKVDYQPDGAEMSNNGAEMTYTDKVILITQTRW
jgi:hypothetical protein